jgi:hypothetical protein
MQRYHPKIRDHCSGFINSTMENLLLYTSLKKNCIPFE